MPPEEVQTVQAREEGDDHVLEELLQGVRLSLHHDRLELEVPNPADFDASDQLHHEGLTVGCDEVISYVRVDLSCFGPSQRFKRILKSFDLKIVDGKPTHRCCELRSDSCWCSQR